MLFLRDVPTELIREVKAVAARRGQTLTTVVTEALTRSLGGDGASTASDSLQGDMDWYRKRRASLVKRYEGAYVAIIDQKIVDHGRAFDQLAVRVFARYGNRNIYMPRVTAHPEDLTVVVRSPRRSRS